MTHELTPFQQSLMDAAEERVDAAFDEAMHRFSDDPSEMINIAVSRGQEAKAKFRALVEKAVEDKELEWYRNQINKLSRGPFYEY